MAEKIICVVGPTACGKTKLGVLLAKRYDGEVVSADSMQIYKGMTIGTAAPTAEEMEGVPHHMIAVADPAEQWSAARYARAAVPIVDDMAEIGIQVWQGTLPENDIPALQAHLNGRLTLMGGFGAAIDRKDATPEDILTYARDVLKRNCPGGHYIPSITYGLAGTVYPHVDKYLNQAVDEYNAALHVPVTHLPPVPRRSVHAAAAPAQSAPEAEQPQGDVLSRIASALVRGQQKRVLQLCSEALESGHGAQEILADGLVRGMTILGEDFSANRAFVPEMLIAARCMAAATELLKPYMTGESSETIGRVCLGTVRGDMHDIGKNLVKIMMEGSGLEVVDRRGRHGGAVRGHGDRTALRHHRLLLAADDDDAGNARCGGAGEGPRHPRPGEDLCRRCAHHAWLQRRDRRGRLLPGRGHGRALGCAARKRIKDIMQECVSAGRTYAGRRHFHFLGVNSAKWIEKNQKGGIISGS